MVEWRQRADAHEFPRPDLDYRNAGIVVEMGNNQLGHDTLSNSGRDGRTIAVAARQGNRTRRAGNIQAVSPFEVRYCREWRCSNRIPICHARSVRTFAGPAVEG